MNQLTKTLGELRAVFTLSSEQKKKIIADFQEEMAKGLRGQPGSLKMLSSHLSSPTGQEKGQFLALDFGGTNGRLLLVELQGKGKITIHRQQNFLFKDQNHDYTQGSGEELFAFLAQQIASFIDPGQTYYLGHTFSFPFVAEGINKGKLLKWTKEFKVAGVEGQDVMKLLGQALKERKVHNLVLGAILNDTVGTQLTAAYENTACRLGSIIGTGHNTAYLEQDTIINLESGNFNLLPHTIYDEQLDKKSENPGGQWLEKMVSGRYLGEIVSLIMTDLSAQGLIDWRAERVFSTKEMSLVLAKPTDALLYQVCRLVRNRSLQLIATTYQAILAHLPEKKETIIAIDGSLFEKMPGYAELLAKELEGKAVKISLTKDGSGKGAAIAAAISQGKI